MSPPGRYMLASETFSSWGTDTRISRTSTEVGTGWTLAGSNAASRVAISRVPQPETTSPSRSTANKRIVTIFSSWAFGPLWFGCTIPLNWGAFWTNPALYRDLSTALEWQSRATPHALSRAFSGGLSRADARASRRAASGARPPPAPRAEPASSDVPDGQRHIAPEAG